MGNGWDVKYKNLFQGLYISSFKKESFSDYKMKPPVEPFKIKE